MRYINKYKILSNLDLIDSRIPLRILKFRRPKWQKVQKKLLNKLKQSGQFFKKNSIFNVRQKIKYDLLSNIKNNITHSSFLKTKSKRLKNKKRIFNTSIRIKKKINTWDKVKNYYKDGLKLKTNIVRFFDNSVSLSSLKKKDIHKNLSIRDFFQFSIIKSEFRIDILLFRLNFFSSSFQARQSLNEGEILLNFKKVTGNVFLKKGDIITFSSKKSKNLFDFKNIINKQSLHYTFCPFVEIDFYSKTIVIFKDLIEFTNNDINFLFPNYFDYKKFKDYV